MGQICVLPDEPLQLTSDTTSELHDTIAKNARNLQLLFDYVPQLCIQHRKGVASGILLEEFLQSYAALHVNTLRPGSTVAAESIARSLPAELS